MIREQTITWTTNAFTFLRRAPIFTRSLFTAPLSAVVSAIKSALRPITLIEAVPQGATTGLNISDDDEEYNNMKYGYEFYAPGEQGYIDMRRRVCVDNLMR